MATTAHQYLQVLIQGKARITLINKKLITFMVISITLQKVVEVKVGLFSK
jgi:hypothetical protein